MILYTQRNRIGKERTEFILRRLMERKNSHSLIFPLVRKAELSAWEWNRSYCAEGAGFQSPFPLNCFPPQWERHAGSGFGSFFGFPLNMNFPLNAHRERYRSRFTKIFESRRQSVEKQGGTRFKTVNLVNMNESRRSIPRSWSVTKASKKEKKALTKREK